MDLCDHCRRVIGSENDGYAYVGEMRLCHPRGDNLGRPNCFVLVTKYSHQRDCGPCRMAGMAVTR